MPDIPTLISGAVCIDGCIPSGMRMSVLIYLANQIVENGGGGGGAVSSVFGRIGAVVAQAGDYTAADVGALDQTAGDARYVLKSGDTMTGLLTIAQATANTAALISTGYSLTGANAQSLIDLAGTWNTSGTPTAFKLNITDTASNAASLLMDWQVGGVSKLKLSKAGVATFDGNILFATHGVYNIGAMGNVNSPANIHLAGNLFSGGNIEAGGGSAIYFSARSIFRSPVDGQLTLLNAAETGFTALNLGGTTSSFPALKRSTTSLQARLADDSAFTNFTASTFTIGTADTGWSATNVTADKVFDANATTLDEIADVLGTLLARLRVVFPGLVDA